MSTADPRELDVEAATRTVELESGTFPVVDHGEGDPVLLLHGFPDSRHMWRYQVPALADEGLRVIAPDLRGFGEAPRPEGVENYDLERIVGDVLGILNALDVETFELVAHDWGAVVGWILAATQPDRVERYAALSVGAPGAPGRRSLEQRENAWYTLFFQFEGTAEAWLRHDDWELFREWLRDDGDVERYLEDLSRPGALTAGLNWYRANARPTPPDEEDFALPDVTCPVLGVWSDGDNYLTEGQMLGSTETVDGPWEYERVEGASHWLTLDVPGEVNDILVEFLTE